MNTDGRDVSTGRFGAGNKFSRGNALAGRMAELRREVLDAVTPDEVKAVFRKLFDLAVAGDVAACRIYLDFVVGRPVQAVEVSAPEGRSIDFSAVAACVLNVVGDAETLRVKIASAFAEMGRVGSAS